MHVYCYDNALYDLVNDIFLPTLWAHIRVRFLQWIWLPLHSSGSESNNHMPAVLKSVMTHRSLWGHRLVGCGNAGLKLLTHRVCATLLPVAEYSTCLSDWCSEVTEGGRSCGGRKRGHRKSHNLDTLLCDSLTDCFHQWFPKMCPSEVPEV